MSEPTAPMNGAKAYPKNQPGGAMWETGELLNKVFEAGRANAPIPDSGNGRSGIDMKVSQDGLKMRLSDWVRRGLANAISQPFRLNLSGASCFVGPGSFYESINSAAWTPIVGQGAPFAIASGTKVWLEATINNDDLPFIEAVEIKFGASWWTEYPSQYRFDVDDQTKAFRALGEIILLADGITLAAKQHVVTNLAASQWIASGATATVIFDH